MFFFKYFELTFCQMVHHTLILHLGQGGRKYTNVIQKKTGKLTIKFTYHTLHFITSIIMFIITKTKTCRTPSQGDEHPLCT